MVSTIAGTGSAGNADGTGVSASFTNPSWCTFYQQDTYVLVGTEYNVRKIVYSTGDVTRLAGGSSVSFADGVGTIAQFNRVIGITVTPDNLEAIAIDQYNQRIRRIVLSTAVVTTLAGRAAAGEAYGVGTNAQFNGPIGIALYPVDNSFVLITNSDGNTILKLDISTAAVSLFAGVYGSAGAGSNGIGTLASFNRPAGILFHPTGSYSICAEFGGGSNTIRKLTYPGAVITTFAGSTAGSSVDGTGASATFNSMRGITIDAKGNYAIVAELGANKLRKIVLSTAVVSAFAGSGSSTFADGVAGSAGIYGPHHVCFTDDGNAAVVAVWTENRLRLVRGFEPTPAPTGQPSGLSV